MKNAKVFLYIGISFLIVYLISVLSFDIRDIVNYIQNFEDIGFWYFLKFLTKVFFNVAVLLLLIGSMFGKNKVIKIISISFFLLVKFINLIGILMDYFNYFVNYTYNLSFLDKMLGFYSVYALFMTSLTILTTLSLIILVISLFMKKESKALIITNVFIAGLSMVSLFLAKFTNMLINQEFRLFSFKEGIVYNTGITIFPIIYLLIGIFMITHAHIKENNHE